MKQKKFLLSLMKKIVIQPNSKANTAIPKPNLHLPISLATKKSHLKAVHKHSQIKQVDHSHDPSPGQLIRKKKMEKKSKKIKRKDRIHTVKGRRSIRSRWSIGSIPLRTWKTPPCSELDSSMFSQTRRKQKD